VVKSPFRVLSLCSGVAGLDAGVRLAVKNARTICYVENDAYACGALDALMEAKAVDDAPIWTDLRTFDGRPWRGAVDCVMGGFPCQPFSVAGKRRGVKDPRHLWPHFARIIDECRPKWAFLENVPGILSLATPDGRFAYQHVEDDLLGMGFRVEAGIYSAEEIGASHKRERVFVLAHAESDPGRPGIGAEKTGIRQNRIRRRGLAIDGGELADPDGKGRRQAERGEAEEGRPVEPRGGMAEPDGPRRQAPGAGRQKHPRREPEQERLPVFPPGPGDRDGWSRVLAARPDLAPAIGGEAEAQSLVRRVADGLPGGLERRGESDRPDRLCALGNAVVPACACVAFLSLTHRIGRKDFAENFIRRNT